MSRASSRGISTGLRIFLFIIKTLESYADPVMISESNKMSETVPRRRFVRYAAKGLSALALTLFLGRDNSVYGVNLQNDERSNQQFGKPVYTDFLDIISDERYNVCPIVEYESSYRPDKVNVLLRHDCDEDNGFGMTALDFYYNIRSTCYLRTSLESQNYYSIESVIDFYKLLEEEYGFEMGYHYEDVDYCGHPHDPNGNVVISDCVIGSFRKNLARLRKYLNIRTVTPHGGQWNYLLEQSPLGIRLFEECKVFSAYQIPSSRQVFHLGDTDNVAGFKEKGVRYFKEELEKHKPGDIVEILIHPHPRRWQYQTYRKPPDLIRREVPETNSFAPLYVSALLATVLALSKRKFGRPHHDTHTKSMPERLFNFRCSHRWNHTRKIKLLNRDGETGHPTQRTNPKAR